MKKTKKIELEELLSLLRDLSMDELFHLYIEAKTGEHSSYDLLSIDISETINLLAVELDKLYQDKLTGSPFVNQNDL